MNWTQPIDNYCERLDPSFWAEPLNAVTNAAFLIAALIMAWRLRRAHLPMANVLVAIVAAIGIGSFLFHTIATRWAALADTAPILVFILAYIFAATRDFFGAKTWRAALVTLGFLPFAAVTVPLFGLIPGLGASAGYAPVPLVIAGYAIALRHRAPTTARNMALAAGLLVVSLTLRTLDLPLCAASRTGTHFLWHILNGVLLAWLIETYRRHSLAGTPRGR